MDTVEVRLLTLILNDVGDTLLTDNTPSSGPLVSPHRNTNGVLGNGTEKLTVVEVIVPGFRATIAAPRLKLDFFTNDSHADHVPSLQARV